MFHRAPYDPFLDGPSGTGTTRDPAEGAIVTTTTVAPAEASGLVALGRDLDTATPVGDIVDVLATGAAAKPLAGVTLCYTERGHPAWEAVDTGADALRRDALGDRLDELGFEWRLTPVRTAVEDREYTWYDLMLALPESEGARYLRRARADPAARDHRTYGRELGYPESAIDWFVGGSAGHDRSVFDVLRADDADPLSIVHAASVPYVPAPTSTGAADAVADGRALVRDLCRLADDAGELAYVRDLLAERVEGVLARHDVSLPGRAVVAAAMPC